MVSPPALGVGKCEFESHQLDNNQGVTEVLSICALDVWISGFDSHLPDKTRDSLMIEQVPVGGSVRGSTPVRSTTLLKVQQS